MNIGDLIKSRRAELGLTLEEIGIATGVRKSTVKKWENGSIKNIGHNRISALANILQIDPAILVASNWVAEEETENGLTLEEVLHVTKFSEVNPYISLLKYGATSRFVIYGIEQSKFMKLVAEKDHIYFNAIGPVSIDDLAEAFCAIFEKKVPPADHYITAHFEVVYTGLPRSILSVRKTDGEHSYVLVNANHYPRPETDEEAAKMALDDIKTISPLKMKEAAPAKVAAFEEGKSVVTPEGTHDERKTLMSKLDEEQE